MLADEAYYALFAGKIDWGYFDHPPVVALMIKAGLWLGNTEAGVRCVAVLLSAGSIFLIEQLIKPNNPLLFYGLILATAIFHFMGFVATPDVPFLFFAVLFWLVYQRWSIGYSAKDAVFAGVLAGVMLLSKYHGILVIGFTVLSNPGIFKRKTFWLAVILAVIILLPHLFWQINHGFPTLQYHLSDRGSLGYDVVNTIKFFPAILLMMGPLIAPFLLWGAFAAKPYNPTEKALKFSFAGTLIFFLLMTAKGSVEPHWLMPAVVPALYFGYKHIEKNRKLTRWALVLSMISVLLIVPVRIAITTGFDALELRNLKIKNPFSDPGDWIASTSQLAGDRPVAFINSYQRASLYTFYSGKPAFSLNNVAGRKNQFDVWGDESSYRGQEVIIVPNYAGSGYDTIPETNPVMQYKPAHNFQSYSTIQFQITETPTTIHGSDSMLVTVMVQIPEMVNLAHPEHPPMISVQLFSRKKIVYDYPTNILITKAINGQKIRFQIPPLPEPGEYGMYVSVRAGWLPPTINSKRVVFEYLTDQD